MSTGWIKTTVLFVFDNRFSWFTTGDHRPIKSNSACLHVLEFITKLKQAHQNFGMIILCPNARDVQPFFRVQRFSGF